MSLVVIPKKFFVCLSLLLLLSGLAGEAYARESSVQIHVKGVSCPFCVYGIEKKLKQIPNVESVETNYKKSTISFVRKKESPIDVAALRQAVQDAGFSMDVIRLRLQGILTEWEGKPALKEEGSHQLFLLIETGAEEPHAFLSANKLNALKKVAGGNQHLIWIEGEVHHHGAIPLAITVDAYGK